MSQQTFSGEAPHINVIKKTGKFGDYYSMTVPEGYYISIPINDFVKNAINQGKKNITISGGFTINMNKSRYPPKTSQPQ